MTKLVVHSIIAAGLAGIALLPRSAADGLAMTPQSERDKPQPSALSPQPSVLSPQSSVPSPQSSVLDVVGRFVEYVQQRESYPETARRFVAEEWQRRKDGTALRTFIPEALTVLHSRFKIGLDAYEARQYDYCAKIMGELSLNSAEVGSKPGSPGCPCWFC